MEAPDPSPRPTTPRPRRQLKLRAKVLALLTLASLGPVLVAGLINLHRAQDQAKASVRVRYTESARLRAMAIQALLERVASNLAQAALRLQLDPSEVDAARARLDAGDARVFAQSWPELTLLRRLNSDYRLALLALPDGRPFACTPYHNVQQIPDLSAVLRLQSERANLSPVRADLSALIPTERHRAVMRQPIRVDGTILAWLIVALEPAALGKLLQPLVHGQRGEHGADWALVDSTGIIIAHHDPARVGALVARPLRAQTATSGEVTLGGVPHLFSRAPLLGTDWSLQMALRTDFAYREVSVLGWILSGVILVTLLIVLLAADTLANVLLRPIRELERGAQMLGAGALEYRIDLASHATDELGRLAASFNQMGGNLQRNRQALKAYSRSLENANAELDAIVHGMSHDLKKSLQSIDGFATFLAEDHGPSLGAAGQSLVSGIASKVDRINELVDDLVRLIERGRGQREATRFSLEAVVREAAEVLASKLPGEVVAAGPLPEIQADRPQIFILLLELMENGLRFNRSATPRVIVRAVDDGLDWRVEVEDNGIGIPEPDRERVFEIFTRLHPGDAFPGSGTGLAMARRIAQEHRGRVVLRGAAGGGTCAALFLPKSPMLLTQPAHRISPDLSPPDRPARG